MLLLAFWQEGEEQVPKVEMIIFADKRLINDMNWMQDKGD